MPDYRRLACPGASIFFTVKTHRNRPILTNSAIEILRDAVRVERQRRPFQIDAMVVLPNHLHTIWTLPPGDTEFSLRWRRIKTHFTKRFLTRGGKEGLRNASRTKRGERAIWQRRFWDHVIRDDDEYGAFLDYIHWNPTKHGWAKCPHAWQWSSFGKWVRAGHYARTWMCCCGTGTPRPPRFEGLDGLTGE